MHPISDTKDATKVQDNDQAGNSSKTSKSGIFFCVLGFLAFMVFTGFVDEAATRMTRLVEENALREKVLSITLTKLFPDDAETIARAFGAKALSQQCPEVFPAGHNPHQD
jgi:hypothetical protein